MLFMIITFLITLSYETISVNNYYGNAFVTERFKICTDVTNNDEQQQKSEKIQNVKDNDKTENDDGESEILQTLVDFSIASHENIKSNTKVGKQVITKAVTVKSTAIAKNAGISVKTTAANATTVKNAGISNTTPKPIKGGKDTLNDKGNIFNEKQDDYGGGDDYSSDSGPGDSPDEVIPPPPPAAGDGTTTTVTTPIPTTVVGVTTFKVTDGTTTTTIKPVEITTKGNPVLTTTVKNSETTKTTVKKDAITTAKTKTSTKAGSDGEDELDVGGGGGGGGGGGKTNSSAVTPPPILLYSFQWSSYSVYFTFSAFLILLSFLKAIFSHVHFLSSRIPEPSIMIGVGAIVGGVLHITGLTLSNDPTALTGDDTDFDIYGEPVLKPTFPLPAFTQNLYFFVLVPPMVLESAYTLHDHQFVANLGPILLFAIVGKVLCAFGIGFSLLYAGNHAYIKEFEMIPSKKSDAEPFNYTLQTVDTFLLASIVTGIDGTPILPIFEDTGVNKHLYFILLGESLLNDAVTTAMYSAVLSLKTNSDEEDRNEYAMAVASFLVAAFGGLFIGIVSGLLTSLLTRISTKNRILEPYILLGVAYFAFVAAEIIKFSGQVCLIGCGVVQAHYAFKNISDSSLNTILNFTKMLSTMCETIVFTYIGMGAVTSIDKWHFTSVAWTLGLCTFFRVFVIFILSGFYNAVGGTKIDFKDQLIIGYGGLRGSVCFALVNMIPKELVIPKEFFVTIVIVVVLWTILVQGSTVRYFIEILEVELFDPNSRVLFEEVTQQVITMTIAGVEEIASIHNAGKVMKACKDIDEFYFRKIFLNCTERLDLARDLQDIMTNHQRPMLEVRADHVRRTTGVVNAGRPYLGLDVQNKNNKFLKDSENSSGKRTSIPNTNNLPRKSIGTNDDRNSNDERVPKVPNRVSIPKVIEPSSGNKTPYRRPTIGVTPPSAAPARQFLNPTPYNPDYDPFELSRALRIAVRDSPYQRAQYTNQRHNLENAGEIPMWYSNQNNENRIADEIINNAAGERDDNLRVNAWNEQEQGHSTWNWLPIPRRIRDSFDMVRDQNQRRFSKKSSTDEPK